ncbi:MAG: type II secretion system F family protein [Bilifractor sp.]|jgi:tight adherence protein B
MMGRNTGKIRNGRITGFTGVREKSARGKEKIQKKETIRKKPGARMFFLTPKEVLQTSGLCGLAGAAAVWLCYEDIRAFPAGLVTAVILFRMRKKSIIDRKKGIFQKHFGEFLSALYSGVMAGYSMENGVLSAREDLEKLYGNGDVLVFELKDICRQMRLHVPVSRLFSSLGERSDMEDIRNFGEVLTIASRTGGNPDQTIQVCYRAIVEKIDTQQEIETVIAAKKFEQTVMSLIPAGIILYLKLSFGSFMDPLYGNFAGAAIMTAALGIFLAAVWLGERMVRIEV